jgi:hypothetical protein
LLAAEAFGEEAGRLVDGAEVPALPDLGELQVRLAQARAAQGAWKPCALLGRA